MGHEEQRCTLDGCRIGSDHRSARQVLVGDAHPALRRGLLLAAFCVICFLTTAAHNSMAQMAPTGPTFAADPATLPEPIFWKQHLFLIPYKWNSAAEPASALAVSLYISKDHGVSWQKISDAKPQVKAFNYRAEADGEYWFAVRTLDNRGRTSPAGPLQPELRVIVDTTIPRIGELRARPTETGAIDIQCRAADANLDPASLRIEAQMNAASEWQPVSVQSASSWDKGAGNSDLLRASWQPPAGVRPLAIRATISDRAGNSTVYQTPVETAPIMTGPLLSQPSVSPIAAAQAPFAAPTNSVAPNVPNASPLATVPLVPTTPGWTSAATALMQPATTPATQPWPAGTVARAPFQLWTSGNTSTDDGRTVYGNPQLIDSGPALNVGSVPFSNAAAPSQPRVHAQFADAVKTNDNGWTSLSNQSSSGPQCAPLEPFRQASVANTQPESNNGPSLVPIGQLDAAAISTSVASTNTPPTHRPATEPKRVGSRTFALEYDLEDAGRNGVARVELWGTRDGGQIWNRYAVDDDNRSPLVVTIDSEGLYGFKILVQAATGEAIVPPRPGDEPELWVSVDLKCPIVELTSIERGEGNLADHLILHWRAQDNNLEPRPIGLFFSSRPTGPWSIIATNLENTGEYAWRVERYVPAHLPPHRSSRHRRQPRRLPNPRADPILRAATYWSAPLCRTEVVAEISSVRDASKSKNLSQNCRGLSQFFRVCEEKWDCPLL